MKYFSLFTGIGGFELGIQQAYENRIQRNRSSQPKCGGGKKGLPSECEMSTIKEPSCVGYSEIDKYAIQVFERHFPNIRNYGDCTKIIASELPDFDLLVGGFPCQSFSIAGKRLGFNDTRGTLFFDIARIAKEKRTKYLLLENVKGLLSHDNGRTFKTIITTIAKLGYDLQWQVLNSKNFGVPQNRERVFIIGYLRGEPRPKVFPIGKSDGLFNETPNEGVAKSLTTTCYKGVGNNGTTLIYEGAGGKTGLYCIASRGRHLVDGKRKDILGAKTTQRLEARKDELMNNLSSVAKDGMLTDGMKIRRLTPTECERLQAFPDNWTKWGINEKGEKIEISDTQRYKMMGNALTTNVVAEIIKRLIILTPKTKR